eukprot:gene11326-6225_t
MLRQMNGKIPGLRDVMVRAGSRYAVWADVERRTDTCEYCKKHDPTWDCDAHIDSRAGRDASYHPEAQYCEEGADGTMLVEEYGIPYLEANGSVRDSYCGTNVVAHEYFHEIHGTAIKTVDYQGYLAIEQATQRGVREGVYVHHPGAKDDGCNPDFSECVAFEFMVKIHLLWNGFPSEKD